MSIVRTEEGYETVVMTAASFKDVRSAIPVGKAAEVFGVTPATVRNWVDKGYIHAVRLPSGIRRIPAGEVERILGQMFALTVDEPEEQVKAAKFAAATPDWDEPAV